MRRLFLIVDAQVQDNTNRGIDWRLFHWYQWYQLMNRSCKGEYWFGDMFVGGTKAEEVDSSL